MPTFFLPYKHRQEMARRKRQIQLHSTIDAIGMGAPPPESVFYTAAKASYGENVNMPNNLIPIATTPTIRFWVDQMEKTILVAVRGTELTSKIDLFADAHIPVNLLNQSKRYKGDKVIFQQVLQQYPSPPYDYYLVGHSLGGAIVTQLKRDYPFLKDAVLYNSAFQPVDLINEDREAKKIYTQDDPLYQLGGKFFQNKQVVPTKRSWITRAIPNVLAKAYVAVKGHQLDEFKPLYGGANDDFMASVMKGYKKVKQEGKGKGKGKRKGGCACEGGVRPPGDEPPAPPPQQQQPQAAIPRPPRRQRMIDQIQRDAITIQNALGTFVRGIESNWDGSQADYNARLQAFLPRLGPLTTVVVPSDAYVQATGRMVRDPYTGQMGVNYPVQEKLIRVGTLIPTSEPQTILFNLMSILQTFGDAFVFH